MSICVTVIVIHYIANAIVSSLVMLFFNFFKDTTAQISKRHLMRSCRLHDISLTLCSTQHKVAQGTDLVLPGGVDDVADVLAVLLLAADHVLREAHLLPVLLPRERQLKRARHCTKERDTLS